MAKKIASIKVIKPGASPDIDSDFHTEHRERAIEYVTDLYGKDNVSNIVTFGTMAAKGALKSMCTIYEIPFKEANELAALIPGAEDGKELTLADIFNPEHHRYSDSEDFRNAVSSSRWESILEGALAVEGKNKSVGVHACGIIISSKKLTDTIPLQVRKDDNRVITQWTYQECESLGLIKMDFLGLDTVDLIQASVENIMKNGKPVPNMTTLIHGDLADKKVYELFEKGETVGIFQFGSEMVRELLLRMKPTEFNDLAACTAVARPGPMGMLSHTKYADRKNGLEKIDYVHPDFNGSAMEAILDPTYGLIVYQEQVAQISNRIAGMTLQEGDDLRKAMGKKKADVMAKLKPKFIQGGIDNGFSDEAMTLLWDTLEPFAKYAFNKSHSVAYALNSYQSAFLKTHYPVEFMAALIEQNIEKRDKTLVYLQEAKSMGLKVVPPNINTSAVKVAPVDGNNSNSLISFGLGAVKSVKHANAQTIVDEREENGNYTSISDVVNRLSSKGVNKDVFVALINSGACDDFGDNRKAMIDFAEKELADSRKNRKKGSTLFDMFEVEDSGDDFDESIVDTFADRISREANALSLYLTAHPVDNVRTVQNENINAIKHHVGRKTFIIPASCVALDVKRGRGKTSYKIQLEDNTGSLMAYAPKDVIARWDKYAALTNVRKAVKKEDSSVDSKVLDRAFNSEIVAQSIPEVHHVMMYKIVTGGYGGYRIVDVFPLYRSHDGSNASRVVLPVSFKPAEREKEIADYTKQLKNIAKNNKGKDSLLVSFVPDMRNKKHWGDRVSVPPAIFDEEALRLATKAGYIDKKDSMQYLKDIYANSDLLKAQGQQKIDSIIDTYHKFYFYEDLGLYVDSSASQLNYDLEDLAGNGNYYL